MATALTRTKQRATWFVPAITGATLLPFLLAPLGQVAGWSSLGIVAVVLGAPHVGTTVAFYFDPELRPLIARNPRRYYVAPALAVLVALAIGIVASRDVRLWLLAGFACWQLHHFTRQNLGVFAFTCRALGMPGPTRQERRVLDLTTVAAACAVPAALVPLSGGRLFLILGTVVLAVTAVLAWRLPRVNAARSAATAFGVVFYLPLFVWSRGSVALLGYALAHGAQYLLMMGHIGRGRRMASAVSAAFLLVGVPLQLMLDHGLAVPVLFAAFYGLTASHFIVDAGVWKMRTPEQRAYMKARFNFL